MFVSYHAVAPVGMFQAQMQCDNPAVKKLVLKFFFFNCFCFQIVMEFCGAGSVSDLMKIRNKTVSQFDYWTR